MLDIFIKSNNLTAKIVPKSEGTFIRCRLFDAGVEVILTISLKGTTLDFSKIESFLGSKPKPIDADKVMEETGYSKDFLPPISIYGVKVLIDSKVFKHNVVKCLISDVLCVKLPVSEINDFNDDVVEVDITKE